MDQEIRLQHSAREPEVSHAHEARAQGCANQFVTIEVNKADLLVSETPLVFTLRQYKLYVALMPWSLGHDDGLGAHAPK
jgi:hypothetical protein